MRNFSLLHFSHLLILGLQLTFIQWVALVFNFLFPYVCDLILKIIAMQLLRSTLFYRLLYEVKSKTNDSTDTVELYGSFLLEEDLLMIIQVVNMKTLDYVMELLIYVDRDLVFVPHYVCSSVDILRFTIRETLK